MLVSFLMFSLVLGVRLFEINGLLVWLTIGIPFLSLLTHPLLYLYIDEITQEHNEKTVFSFLRKKSMHFIPSATILLFSVISYLTGIEEVQHYLSSNESIINEKTPPTTLMIFNVSTFLLYGQAFLYGILIIKSLIRHDINIKNFFSFKKDISLRWLKIFVWFYLLYYLIDILLFLFYAGEENIALYYAFYTIQIHFIGLMAYRQKKIYRLKDTLDEESEEKIIENEDHQKSHAKQILEIFHSIEKNMKENELYKNEDLSLYDLSQLLNTNQKYVSEAINLHAEKNFFSYVNHYRIEAIKEMLLNPENTQLSIEGIAKTCGFKSRGVFYPIFKKETGLTPGAFKKQAGMN